MTDNMLEHDATRPAFDEAELAEALAGLGADSDAFLAGVEAKVASNATGSKLATVTPTWLRRAASIAPPGLTELALAGPSSTAKASLASFLIMPWAMLALGCFAFVGMLAATLRLSASRSDDDVPLRGGAPGLRTWTAIAALPVTIAVASLLRRDSSLLLVAFPLGGMVVVMTVRSLSRAGLANRNRIGAAALAGLLVLGVLAHLTVVGHRDATSAWTLAMLPLIALTSAAIGALSKNGPLAKVLFVSALVYSWLSWGNLTLDPMSREDLVQWCEQFDQDTNQEVSWQTLGHARRALGEPTLDLTRAAEQLQAFAPESPRVRWAVGMSAWRAGLATKQLLAELELTEEAWTQYNTGEGLLHGWEPVGFAAAVALGTLDDAKSKAAWAMVARTMTHAIEVDSIRLALVSIEAAAALGDQTYADRHRDGIHKILLASTAHAGRQRGGFGEWTGPKHDDLLVMFDYTRNGVTLMSYVGVPQALDAYQLDRNLSRGMSRLPRERSVAMAMTRVHLRSLCDVRSKQPALLVFLAENMALVMISLFCGLALWVVVRAPKPIPIEIGPIATPNQTS